MKKNKNQLNQDCELKSKKSSYKNYKDPYFGYSQSDVYYNIERKLDDSQVSIPTYDAVVTAKEWVDDINKK